MNAPTKNRRPVKLSALLRTRLSLQQPAELLHLCLAHRHAPAVQRERSDLIARRVRLIAALFAVLTLAWIPVDAVTIPWPYWGDIMIGRVAATLAFAALALWPRRNFLRVARLFGASAFEAGILIVIPLAFFLYTNDVLSVSGYHGALAVSTAYFYLPFIVAAGLAVFPLTLLEALLPMMLILGAMVIAIDVWPQFLTGQSPSATLWRLFLIASIATLGGMSQLRFLLRLTDQATRDGLTGLLVRGTGEEILENQFAYAQRQKLPFAVIFIDIDRFKSVNDAHGHEAGDAVLRAVAAQIAHAFRHQDVLIRWGGEEFVVGLPGANVANAEIAVLRLAKLGLGLRPDGNPVTASIGIAERQADQLDHLAQLVERADARMYEAKTSGRNRYVFRNGPKPWIGPSESHSQAA